MDNYTASHILNSWGDTKFQWSESAQKEMAKILSEPLKMPIIKFELYYVTFKCLNGQNTIRFSTQDEELGFIDDVNNNELDLGFVEKYGKEIEIVSSSSGSIR